LSAMGTSLTPGDGPQEACYVDPTGVEPALLATGCHAHGPLRCPVRPSESVTEPRKRSGGTSGHPRSVTGLRSLGHWSISFPRTQATPSTNSDQNHRIRPGQVVISRYRLRQCDHKAPPGGLGVP